MASVQRHVVAATALLPSAPNPQHPKAAALELAPTSLGLAQTARALPQTALALVPTAL